MKKCAMKLGIGAVVLFAIGAQAALINVGDSLVINGDISSAADLGYVNGGTGVANYEYAYAGAFNVNVTDSTLGSPTFQIQTFCTDVGVNWQYGNQNYTAEAFAGQTGVKPNWSADPQAIQNASYIYNNIFIPFGKDLTADEAAGVQLAIWKVLYDTATGTSGLLTTTSFSSGNLLAYGFGTTAMSDALTYLNDVDAARSNPSTFPLYSDTWLKPDLNNSQGLIWNSTTPAAYQVAVPEPATIIAGVLLLLPFGVSAYRIVRNRRLATP